jgi:hemolysin III
LRKSGYEAGDGFDSEPRSRDSAAARLDARVRLLLRDGRGDVARRARPTGQARLASVIYGGGLCALFAASGLYHRWRWSPRWKPLLRRIDHSMIYVFIAASSTPIALLVLEGTLQTVVLVSVWTGATLGVAFSLAWIDAPRAVQAATYLAVGWVGAVAVPALLRELGVAAFVLFLVGGILYTAGATIYAAQRPNRGRGPSGSTSSSMCS